MRTTTMNKASDEALTALRVLFASGLADPLFDEIESVYQSELKAARDRTLQTAKGMIEGQLKTLPVFTFKIDSLTDQDMENLACGFIPDGVTYK